MNKELARKIRFDVIIETLKNKGYTFFDGDKPYNINIIGIRARRLATNLFDDFIIQIYRNYTHNFIMNAFPATTETGTYWLKHPMNPHGTATLVPGQYRGAYKIGKHKYYEALIQVKPLKVYRDNNKDDILDLDPDTIEEGYFGINIHRANPYKVDNLVNRWSAACQVIQKKEDFDKFMNNCRISAMYFGNSFTYTLIEEADLDEILNDGDF